MVVSKPIRTNFKASTTTGHNQVSLEAFHPRCRVTRLALPLSPEAEAECGKPRPITSDRLHRGHECSGSTSLMPRFCWRCMPLARKQLLQTGQNEILTWQYASGPVQCRITNHIEFMPSRAINYCAYMEILYNDIMHIFAEYVYSYIVLCGD